MIALLLLLLACSTDPVDGLLACQDLECRQARVADAWKQDPVAVRRILSQQNDMEQELLATWLAGVHAQDALEICGMLAEGSPGRTNCDRKRLRPHLESQRPKQHEDEVERQRPGSGPASSDLPLPELGDAPWSDADETTIAAARSACAGQDLSVCAQQAAARHAQKGDLRSAGIACLASSQEGEKIFRECLFQAAEELASRRGVAAMGDALRLCSHAGFAGAMCLVHVLQLAGPAPTPADQPALDAVAQALAYADTLVISAGSPRVAAALTDRFWSMWVQAAFQGAAQPTGDLLDLLPAQAWPHIRVSAAFKTLQPDLSGPLEASRWRSTPQAEVPRLRANLARRGGTLPSRPSTLGLAIPTYRFSWLGDGGDAEKALPAIFCLGPSRRTVLDDEVSELQIAILEAAFRLPHPPVAEFFVAVLASDAAPEVRWTAARLAAELYPEAVVGLQDPDPLVQHRLDHPIREKVDQGGSRRGPAKPPPAGGP